MENMKNVIGIGELLWDVLPEGKKLGGAPCNFVYHAQKQGALGLALSAIGDDANGKEILEVLKAKNISAELIQVNKKPTSTVDVALNTEGVPEYTIHEDVAWDFMVLNDDTLKAVSEADIICFGSLAQRNSTSRETIEKILNHSRPETLIVYDINLRQNFYNKEIIERSLQLCNVLKLNEDELPVVCDLLGVKAESEEGQILDLIKEYNLKLVAYTKGSEGSLLMTPSEKSYLPTPKVKVKDTVGAGDSFTAVMIVGFANGKSLKENHQKAVEISAFVCTQDGAMPEYN
jgi:fructokinase